MANPKNALFVKGISSDLSDSDILDLMCVTFSHAALFDRAYSQTPSTSSTEFSRSPAPNCSQRAKPAYVVRQRRTTGSLQTALSDDTNKRRTINNYLYGTVDNVIVKRPKFSQGQAESGFINAIVYFEQISFDRIGQHNFDSLNNGGFIKIVFCPSTATTPVKYWKVFKYNGSFQTRSTPSTETGRSPTTLLRNSSGANRSVSGGERLYSTTSVKEFQLESCARQVVRHASHSGSLQTILNLMNVVVTRKYPAPKQNLNDSKYNDEDDYDDAM